MARRKKDVSKISFNLDNTLIKKAQEYADKHHMTFTATMEVAVEEFLKSEEDKEKVKEQ